MTFFLGIDGGGSKTSCLVGDDTSVLGAGSAGGSNIVRVGEVQAREAIASAIQQACTVAGISPSQIERACIGAAGAARPEIRQKVDGIVSALISGRIEVLGDHDTTLAAAFGEGPGVVVISGTGSIAYGRDHEGRTARAGGWGFAVSDEGSGHWIGRNAVTAALRAWDEAGSEDALSAAIMKAWGAPSYELLVLAANATNPPDFATLFPAVLAVADAGDPLARAVLTRAGGELAGLAGIVIRRLFAVGDPVPVAMSGGVFQHSSLVRQVFYNGVRAEFSNVKIGTTVVEPVRGALEMARRGYKTA